MSLSYNKIPFSRNMFLGRSAIRVHTILKQVRQSSSMAPSVLGIGVPADTSFVPWIARGFLQRSLNVMEANMKASRYDWEMLYITPEMEFDLCTKKLREKKWDIVMVGSKRYYKHEVRALERDTWLTLMA